MKSSFQKQETILLIIVSLLSLLLLVVPLLIYVAKFNNGRTSDLPSDWAVFSNYMGLFISTINLLVIATLTLMLYKYNLRRDSEVDIAKKEIGRRDEILERPVLVFRKFKTHRFYTLCNIGKGAALNIIIKSSKKELDTKWEISHTSYSLRSAEEVEMIWTYSCKSIAADYSDIFGNKYGSFMENDQIRVFKLSDEDDLMKFNTEIKKLNQPSWKNSVFLMQDISI